MRITHGRKSKAALSRKIKQSRWGSRSIFKESDLRVAADMYTAGLSDRRATISMDEAAATVPCSRQYLRNYLLSRNMPIRRRGNPGVSL